MSFHFKIGEIISDSKGSIKILKQFRDDKNQKCYEYQCMECGYIGTNTENKIQYRNVRCSVCCNNPKIVAVGFNDIGTTHPWIKEYLINPHDAEKYVAGSQKFIKTKCPICGYERQYRIYDLIHNKKYFCPICSDNISYPNKLMYEILQSLNIDFEREKTFSWSDNKRYDFYIPSLNCIIEMNGGQHYQDAFNRSVYEEQSNDVYKKNLALHSGDIKHYLVIDCRISDYKYIYKNLCKENLLKEIGILNIDIEKCDKNVRQFTSVYQQVSELWNMGLSTTEISVKLNISKVTIGKYLKKATQFGLTNYKGRNDQNKRTKKIVIDLETGKEYESILACSKDINKARTFVQYHKERFKIKENNKHD